MADKISVAMAAFLRPLALDQGSVFSEKEVNFFKTKSPAKRRAFYNHDFVV